MEANDILKAGEYFNDMCAGEDLSESKILTIHEALSQLKNPKKADAEWVSRQIYSAHVFTTDESWKNVWKRQTDPHSVAMGGQWEVLVTAHRIINTLT